MATKRWIDLGYGDQILIFTPAPPNPSTATISQLVEWGSLIAMRNEVYRRKGSSQRLQLCYIKLCDEYCRKWRLSDDEINDLDPSAAELQRPSTDRTIINHDSNTDHM